MINDFIRSINGFHELNDKVFRFRSKTDMYRFRIYLADGVKPMCASSRITDHLSLVNYRYVVQFLKVGHFNSRRHKVSAGYGNAFFTCQQGTRDIDGIQLVKNFECHKAERPEIYTGVSSLQSFQCRVGFSGIRGSDMENKIPI